MMYHCKSCGEHFTINLGFERMKSTPQIITSALQLYFSGASLRKCAEFLKLQGVKVSYVAVYEWIRKCVALMDKYIEKLNPQVSGTWRADELWLKVKGDKKYLFPIMDDETRYWIAQEVPGSKYKHDARKLFQMTKKVTGRNPETLITDGLPAYHDARVCYYRWHIPKVVFFEFCLNHNSNASCKNSLCVRKQATLQTFCHSHSHPIIDRLTLKFKPIPRQLTRI